MEGAGSLTIENRFEARGVRLGVEKDNHQDTKAQKEGSRRFVATG